MSDSKFIPKFQHPFKPLTLENDNTRVLKPIIILPIERKFIPRVAEVRLDNRTSDLRKLDEKEADYKHLQHLEAKDDLKRAEGLLNLLSLTSPANYFETATGEQLSASGKLAFDALAFGLPGLLKRGLTSTLTRSASIARVGTARGISGDIKIIPENAASMTPEQWTAAQDAAIARGDMTEAQRLRDLHAKVKGYNSSLPLYHGSSNENITVFDPYAKPETWEGSGGTTFFTPSFEAADIYAKGKGVLEMTHEPGRVYKVYSAHKNPKIVDYDGASYLGTGTKLSIDPGDGVMRRILNPKGGGHFLDDYTVYTYDKLPIEGLEYPRYYAPPRNKHIVWEKEKVAGSTSEEAAKAMSEGYDVAILKNVDEGVGPNSAKIGPIDDYAIRNPRLIKSADAVTYDDNGVRIPLGKRDTNINDIRYFSQQPVVRTVQEHTAVGNPLQTRLARLQDHANYGTDIADQAILVKPVVHGNEVRNVAKLLEPSLSESDLDMIAQIAYANKRGVHIPIENGNRTTGISIVDILDAINYLKQSGVKNPNTYDVGIIAGHEAGHGVLISPNALKAVSDFSDPNEFYTKIGLVLDDAGITATSENPVQYNQLMQYIKNYLDRGNLDNGITEVMHYLLNLIDPIKKQRIMAGINRFSALTGAGWYTNDKIQSLKEGGKIRKMKTAAGGPIHYSRTMTSDNLSKAANYVGEYVLKGLGAVGKLLNASFTSPTYGTVGQVSYARNTEDAKRQRELSEASEQAMGKAMTWVSPLNYGAAIWNGHGLDARKGEEEVASWSPAWQAVGRVGELYVGPKAVKGVKAASKATALVTGRAVAKGIDTATLAAARAGSKTARKIAVSRAIDKMQKPIRPEKRVPIESGFMYHTFNRRPLGYVKNGIHYNSVPTRGELRINNGKYESVRPSPHEDRIWWDTNGHNIGDNVVVTREGGYSVNDSRSYALAGHGYYKDSYRTTPPVDVNQTVKFTYQPLIDEYIVQSPVRTLVTNKMSIEDLFTPELSIPRSVDTSQIYLGSDFRKPVNNISRNSNSTHSFDFNDNPADVVTSIENAIKNESQYTNVGFWDKLFNKNKVNRAELAKLNIQSLYEDLNIAKQRANTATLESANDYLSQRLSSYDVNQLNEKGIGDTSNISIYTDIDDFVNQTKTLKGRTSELAPLRDALREISDIEEKLEASNLTAPETLALKFLQNLMLDKINKIGDELEKLGFDGNELDAYANIIYNGKNKSKIVDNSFAVPEHRMIVAPNPKDSRYRWVVNHEINHIIQNALKAFENFKKKFGSDTGFNLSDEYLKLLTEQLARGTLIKDFFGIKDGSPITAKMLKYAKEHYSKQTHLNNNMAEFFNSITDFEKAAKWLSYAAAMGIPITLALNTPSQNKLKLN